MCGQTCMTDLRHGAQTSWFPAVWPSSCTGPALGRAMSEMGSSLGWVPETRSRAVPNRQRPRRSPLNHQRANPRPRHQARSESTRLWLCSICQPGSQRSVPSNPKSIQGFSLVGVSGSIQVAPTHCNPACQIHRVNRTAYSLVYSQCHPAAVVSVGFCARTLRCSQCRSLRLHPAAAVSVGLCARTLCCSRVSPLLLTHRYEMRRLLQKATRQVRKTHREERDGAKNGRARGLARKTDEREDWREKRTPVGRIRFDRRAHREPLASRARGAQIERVHGKIVPSIQNWRKMTRALCC